MIDQQFVSPVPSVDMAFRQPDHLSIRRRNCDILALHVSHLALICGSATAAIAEIAAISATKRPRWREWDTMIDQQFVSPVPSVDMAFRQTDHFSVRRRNCDILALHVSHLARNCQSAAAAIAAICANLSVRRGRHFGQFVCPGYQLKAINY